MAHEHNAYFDRFVCACGAMHYYCVDCGACLDDCPYDPRTGKCR